MVQRCGGTGFLLETSQPLGIGREGRRQDLDCDVTSKARIVGPIYFAHAAGANCADDFVRTKARTARQH